MASKVLHVQCIYIIRAECIGGTKPRNDLTPWVVHCIETMAALYLFGRTICASVSFLKTVLKHGNKWYLKKFSKLCVSFTMIYVDIDTGKCPILLTGVWSVMILYRLRHVRESGFQGSDLPLHYDQHHFYFGFLDNRKTCWSKFHEYS